MAIETIKGKKLLLKRQISQFLIKLLGQIQNESCTVTLFWLPSAFPQMKLLPLLVVALSPSA